MFLFLALTSFFLQAPQAQVNEATYSIQRTDEDGIARTQEIAEDLKSLISQKSKDTKPGILMIGDSITQNWNQEGNPLWQKYLGPMGAFNFGVGGDQTQNVIWRIRNLPIEKIQWKTAVVMIGTNNMEFNTAETVAGIKAVVQELQKKLPYTRILLLALFPRDTLPWSKDRMKVNDVNSKLPGLAKTLKISYLDFSSKFLNLIGYLSPESMPDALHPNLRGYQIWIDAMMPVLRNL